jgi:hypothetical protein
LQFARGLWQPAVEPARELPVVLAEEAHDSWDEQALA